MSLSKLSKTLYKAARLTRDVNAVSRAGRKRSGSPIVKRIVNKGIGRIAGKLFLR